MKKTSKIIVILIVGMTILACSSFGFSRDETGALLFETRLPLTMLQSTIESSVDLSQLEDPLIELHEGYIYFRAASINFEGIVFEDLSFHIELSVLEGQLSARMTNVTVSGSEIDDKVFEPVNQMITERLAQSVEQVEQAELVDVRVSPEEITLVWRLNRSNTD
ncbi:MAG: hypothetical protein JW757_06135 [Anaerolineales bacterium]|nr:hypothetical protein [Anaerolineales bacterium]